MIPFRSLTALAAVLTLAACDVEPSAMNEADAPQATQPQETTPLAPIDTTDIAAFAQDVARHFNENSGVNLGGRWHYDRAYAEGNRTTIEIQAPVSGRRYRNNDHANDPLRRDIRRYLCRSDGLVEFFAAGGEIVYIVEGYDNVRIGRYLFINPC